MPFNTKRNQCSLKKHLVPQLGKGWYKMSLEQPVVPKSKDLIMAFPIVMYGCESLTIKMAKQWRVDAFKLWCWTARRSNYWILKEINPEYSLEGLMLKLKLQCFGYLMRRADPLEKTLMLGKTEGRGWKRMRWLEGITDSMDKNLTNSRIQWRTGKPGGLQSMGSQRVWHHLATDNNKEWKGCVKRTQEPVKKGFQVIK